MQRARIRKHSLEESASLSKAADTGKLKRHKDCIASFRVLNNYLSTVMGRGRLSLIYVIRESEAPDYIIELQPDYNFNQLLINCVSLNDLTSNIYARKVHNIIHGLIYGKTKERWINPKEKNQYSQQVYLDVLDHYGGN